MSVRSVVMGLVHRKIYLQSVRPIYHAENHRLDRIAAHYRQHFRLSHFGSNLSVDCAPAIRLLTCLVENTMPLDASQELSAEGIQRFKALMESIPDPDFAAAALLAKTPFDTISTLRKALDALVYASDAADKSSVTGTDELLPLLAYTIVQSGVSNIESLLFYVKNFTQSSLGPEFECVYQAQVGG